MNSKQRQADAEHRWIVVEKLRAGDSVALDSGHALVVTVEKVDQRRVLVAYEGVDEIDYPVGAKLRIMKRRPIPTQHTLA